MTLWRLWRATRTTHIICAYATKEPRANHSSLVHYGLLVITDMTTSDSVKALRRWAAARRPKIDSIEVSNAISIALGFIEESLFKNIVFARFSLHLLQDKVVCRCNLIVLVVLNEHWSLVKEVWICNRKETVFSNLCDGLPHVSHHGYQGLVYNGYWVFSNYDPIKISRFDLVEPFVRANVFYRKSSGWISIQNLFYQILALWCDKAWYQIVTV